MKHSLLPTLGACLLTALMATGCRNTTKTPEQQETPATAPVRTTIFNADSALAFVRAQCDFGPRTPESEAHRRCGDYIVGQFRRYGLEVTEQETTVTGWDNKRLPCRNIIASYRPEQAERILLCAHWDCRPWADQDPDKSRHRQPVMGANDGASGVAVMLELARIIKQLNPAVGVDFICFDMEDYGAPYWGADNAPEDGSDWCLGSRYWASNPHRTGYVARYGILLDMVGGPGARFCHEGFSLRYAADIVQKVWAAAQAVGADRYFVNEDGSWATDDHLPLNEIAGIPTVDVIPFMSDSEHSFGPYWHTVNDTPENISAETLKAVGDTMAEIIANEK